tara:strand:- start:476 stop:1918 length:1443 start_codon:yes stop_codon:yes gene_type:complete
MGIDVTELLDLDFDEQFSIGQGTRQDIKSDKKGFKFKDVEINLDPKRGIGNRNKVEDEEVEDALRNIQESLTKTKVADIKAKPVSAIRTVDAPTTEYKQVASIDPRTPIVETQDPALAQTPDVDYDFFDSDELMVVPESTSTIQDVATFAESEKGQDYISKGLDILNIENKPITKVGDYNLPGYANLNLSMGTGSTGYAGLSTAQKQANLLKASQPSTGAPTLTGQLAGASSAVLGAYSAYDALKGGIDSPTEALQFAGGTLTTLAGLQTAGIMAGSQFATMMAGPVGWAIAGASFLAASGILGGKGNSKPPMGGVEFRLVDDAGKQHAYVEEGQKRRIKAVNAHSYNGFNSSALLAQANKNVDYMYAFADHFDLKVNEKAWSQAAFGGDGVDKYMPRGGQAPYRSVLERIDSAGDGSVSPSEWLRHAMEYEGPNGERIVEGDIYKGIRIGPDGLPMKVGYKSQEAFQEAVADFNKQFYA